MRRLASFGQLWLPVLIEQRLWKCQAKLQGIDPIPVKQRIQASEVSLLYTTSPGSLDKVDALINNEMICLIQLYYLLKIFVQN